MENIAKSIRRGDVIKMGNPPHPVRVASTDYIGGFVEIVGDNERTYMLRPSRLVEVVSRA